MPWSLANAFSAPVVVRHRSTDLTGSSIETLRSYDAELKEMYGETGVVLDRAASTFEDHRDGTVADLMQAVSEVLA